MHFPAKLNCFARFGYGDGYLCGRGQSREDRLCSNGFCDQAAECAAAAYQGQEPEDQVVVYLANFDTGADRGRERRAGAVREAIWRREEPEREQEYQAQYYTERRRWRELLKEEPDHDDDT